MYANVHEVFIDNVCYGRFLQVGGSHGFPFKVILLIVIQVILLIIHDHAAKPLTKLYKSIDWIQVVLLLVY